MNEIERTLQAVLQSAAAETTAPVGLVARAQRQAVHIRRRRTATRASLGVVSAVAGGVAIAMPGTQVTGDRVDIEATASASPSAAQAAESGVRISRTASCEMVPEPRPGLTCTRTTMEIIRPGQAVQQLHLTDRAGPEGHTGGDPVSLLVEYVDGTSETVAARQESEGAWFFDVDLRPNDEIERMVITGSDGSRLEWVRDDSQSS